MIQVLYIESHDEGDRLSKIEADTLAVFCYQIHDHTAKQPQPTLFWWRDKSCCRLRMN